MSTASVSSDPDQTRAQMSLADVLSERERATFAERRRLQGLARKARS